MALRAGRLASAGLALTALAAAGCSSSPSNNSGSTPHPSSPTSSGAAGTTLKTAKISGKTVLTNAKGFTLYSFAPDTSTTSRCNGNCATAWPPVKGPGTAGAGVTGKITEIKRSDGRMQAVYNGRPLYTFTGDTAPGQANGNGSTAFGGLWRVVPATGTAVPTAGSSSSGGGGY